jgi:hypothetical protein
VGNLPYELRYRHYSSIVNQAQEHYNGIDLHNICTTQVRFHPEVYSRRKKHWNEAHLAVEYCRSVICGLVNQLIIHPICRLSGPLGQERRYGAEPSGNIRLPNGPCSDFFPPTVNFRVKPDLCGAYARFSSVAPLLS